jgi:GMP synthase (glutamine-hydrolysing)
VPGKSTLLVVEHEKECPPAHLGGWLTDAGAELHIWRPYLGEPQPEAGEYDGLVVLGGSMGADDDAACDWIGPTKELLRRAVDAGAPTLGICLGHQLLASALGGRVAANPPGHQLGLLEIGWTEAARDDPLMAALAHGPARRGVHWNHDVVLEPPAGADLLAATPAGEVQALRYGPRAWGVQWHPEVDVPVLVRWAEGDRADHLERGIDQQALLDEIDAARAELDHAWRPLATRFAALVAGSRVP